jgi:hypothetical protein
MPALVPGTDWYRYVSKAYDRLSLADLRSLWREEGGALPVAERVILMSVYARKMNGRAQLLGPAGYPKA